MHERAAERAPELVPIERRHRILDQRAIRLHGLADEEIAGVEGVVAQELVAGAAQLIRARLRGHRDDAGATAELRREHAGQDLEFTHLLDRWHDDEGVEGELVVVDAVDHPRIGVRLRPERIEVGGAARVEGARTGEVLARLARCDPRCQVHERGEVPAVQRQFLDRHLLDDRAGLRGIGAHDRRTRDHRGGLFDRAHFERHVDAHAVGDLQDDAGTDPGLESLELHLHLVGPGHQERRGIDAAPVGHERRGRVPVDLADRDLCAGNDLTGRVADGPGDAPGRDLGGRGAGGEKREEHEDDAPQTTVHEENPGHSHLRAGARARSGLGLRLNFGGERYHWNRFHTTEKR